MAAPVAAVAPAVPVPPTSDLDRFECVVRIVCAVAIAVFALYQSPTLFCGSAVVGFSLGRSPDHTVGSFQSVMSNLTGKRLPRGAELVATLTALLGGMHFQPLVFVPISGFYLGARVGVIVGPYLPRVK